MVASKVMYVALRRLNHPDVSPQDMEDMQQEAALALWRNDDKFPDDPDRSRGYAFGAAVKEVCKAFVRQITGKNPYAVELPDRWGEETLKAEEREAAPVLSDEILGALTEIFAESHVQKTGRAKDAVIRDVAICAMLYAGHNNESIALTFDISIRYVQTYRRRLRATLRRYCDQHGITVPD